MRRPISWTWKCLEVDKCYQKIFKTFCNEIILRFPFTALENGGGAFVSSCTYYVIQLKHIFPKYFKASALFNNSDICWTTIVFYGVATWAILFA